MVRDDEEVHLAVAELEFIAVGDDDCGVVLGKLKPAKLANGVVT